MNGSSITNTYQNNNIVDYREYNIENNEYNLRIEIDQQYIYFNLTKINQSLEFIYKNKMDFSNILKLLDLNTSNHSFFDLKIFDKINKLNNISIKNNDDNSYTLNIKIFDYFQDEKLVEIKLYKEFMNNNDKFNILFNEIKLNKKENDKIENNKEIEDIQNKINELNINMNKKEKNIKDILIKNENKIKEINEKMIKKENEINDIINQRIKNFENKLINEFNEKFNAMKNNLNNEINCKNIMDEKLKNNTNNKIENKCNKIYKNEEYNNKLLNEKDIMNNIFEDITKFKEEINNKINIKDKEINKIMNCLKEKEKNINSINEKINNQEKIIQNKINNDIKKIINNINEINNKINEKELRIKDINNNIKEHSTDKSGEINSNISSNNNEYTNKINYKFKKEPKNLKYKLDISKTNIPLGWNDIFEVFISYKDKQEYLISPNKNFFNLDIFTLLDNKKILALKGHKNDIRTIRYFINENNFNEYLISADDNKIVIIWDITDNYNIKYQFDTKYTHNIYSCLLIFPHNIDDNYIITSTFNKSDDINISATKIYSLNNGKYISYIKNSNYNVIYYLLSWYNKSNNNYYIIQFSFKKIIINNLIEGELYSELKEENEDNHFSGFIFNKDNNDYLCCSSYNGYINIWDLYNKKIFKIININQCELAHIIEWNNKYIIVADISNKSFKIIDIEENKIICDIKGQHKKELICIKKIYHPLYGEALLSAGGDYKIKLWII